MMAGVDVEEVFGGGRNGFPLLSHTSTIELTSYDTVLIFTNRATKMVHLIPKPTYNS